MSNCFILEKLGTSLRGSTTSLVVERELYDLATNSNDSNCNLALPCNRRIRFSIDSIRKQPCQRARTPSIPLLPPPSCGGALVNRCFVQSFPYWSRRNGSPLLSKRTKGKEILGNRRNDDASTAANTPRLIRLERGRGGVSSPPFSVREDSAQNVVAWLRANASRFSGVDSPPGTNEAKGREEENRRKGMFKGDGFLLSFEERATRAFDQFLARIFANGPRSSSQF